MSSVMSLDGGIVLYDQDGEERYHEKESPKGKKVVFLNKNGDEKDLKGARRTFKEGQELEVKEIYVYGWHSYVEFTAYPNEFYNTVMFGDVEED